MRFQHLLSCLLILGNHSNERYQVLIVFSATVFSSIWWHSLSLIDSTRFMVFHGGQDDFLGVICFVFHSSDHIFPSSLGPFVWIHIDSLMSFALNNMSSKNWCNVKGKPGKVKYLTHVYRLPWSVETWRNRNTDHSPCNVAFISWRQKLWRWLASALRGREKMGVGESEGWFQQFCMPGACMDWRTIWYYYY